MTSSEQADDAVLNSKAAALEGDVLRAGEGGQAGDGAGGPPPGPSTGEVLTALLKPTFAIMAPNWEVSDDECAMMGHSYGAVIDKYFPDLDLGVELSALIVTVAIFGPRTRRPRHKPQPAPVDEATG